MELFVTNDKGYSFDFCYFQMMHVLDYDRALGELLELDDTIRASIAREFL